MNFRSLGDLFSQSSFGFLLSTDFSVSSVKRLDIFPLEFGEFWPRMHVAVF